MSFDEDPRDNDPHAECRTEIESLRAWADEISVYIHQGRFGYAMQSADQMKSRINHGGLDFQIKRAEKAELDRDQLRAVVEEMRQIIIAAHLCLLPEQVKRIEQARAAGETE